MFTYIFIGRQAIFRHDVMLLFKCMWNRIQICLSCVRQHALSRIAMNQLEQYGTLEKPLVVESFQNLRLAERKVYKAENFQLRQSLQRSCSELYPDPAGEFYISCSGLYYDPAVKYCDKRRSCYACYCVDLWLLLLPFTSCGTVIIVPVQRFATPADATTNWTAGDVSFSSC